MTDDTPVWRTWWLALTLLLVVSGCDDGRKAALDPALFAGEGIADTLRRTFSPRAYWTAKVNRLQEQVEEARTAYHDRGRVYHDLLNQRREQMAQAAGKFGEQEEQAKRVARQKVLQTYRTQLAELRQANREATKTLRQRGQLLRQAQDALLAAGGILPRPAAPEVVQELPEPPPEATEVK